MPSTARSRSIGSGSPTAPCASQRCTAVSCAIRRAQKPLVAGGPHVHTGRSGPASAQTRARSAAPAANQSGTSASVSGRCIHSPRESGSIERLATVARPHACAPPQWRASSARSHSGQLGTCVSRGDERTTASSAALSRAIAAT
jgi:hypothetical protein